MSVSESEEGRVRGRRVWKVAAACSGLIFAVSLEAQTVDSNAFVRRSGTRLLLEGRTFRYSGPNIEWLGLEAYGPDDALGPRYPSRMEIDDALDTAKMMGARVVRSQTMGDSVGCDLCIEPHAGTFNADAFKPIDYAVKAAHDRGLRLIITLVGDCSNCTAGGLGEYVEWSGQQDLKQFFTDERVIKAYERHIAEVLNHTNPLTGVKYKDDPTIMAWENCNVCGLFAQGPEFSRDPARFLRWIDTIGDYIKSIDHNHLYEDNSGFFLFNQSALDAHSTDIVTAEYYPHWDWLFGFGQRTTAATFSEHARRVTAKGKVYVANEYGWDVTDWPTRASFQAVLTRLETDPNISGDGFWALQAHADKFGWQLMPAPAKGAAYAKWGETGEWWALFYGGVTTDVDSAEDMQDRAEMLRAHAFAMAGMAAPMHPIPPAPVITFKGIGLVAWHGSVGAVKYTVQRRKGSSSAWETACDRCATDADTPWIDKGAAGLPFGELFALKYRVIAYNADGKSSQPSAER